MVIISHGQAFLDQLCTKIVETDMGVSRTYEGSYSEYYIAKAAWIESQNAACEKQQKEIEHTKDLIHRLGAGANSGSASSAGKARLAFCKFVVKPSTLLVLDEPTNHLDIPSKEMLEEAINEYKGTVITVSHDRYFIKQIVNRVVEVKDRRLQDYAGNYNYYLEKNLDARERELHREAEIEEKAPKVKAKSKMSKAEKEARKKQKI
ncbi:ABC transporter F family member 2 [Rosa chinensis]|uniref:ABC transporter F family member 2 n=1 Tax=Rosa chinensis TaxID=74649 RepID=UPI001AD8BCFE|nr:ABC transporter F family member 2 [Rosa chinensis]